MLCMGYFLALGVFAATAVAETIHGVTVLTRHGDRTSKHYWNYHITPLGLNQNFLSGSYYRNRYILAGSLQQILGISPATYSPTIVHGTAPDQQILINTATAFLQGLYPPSAGVEELLVNGSTIVNPLGGYQYAFVEPAQVADNDTIWLKGTEQCPAYTAASASYAKSAEFADLVGKTRGFYGEFAQALKGVWDYTNDTANLTYANAYDIFDLLNVASIHNSSIANLTTPDQLFQLRTLADAHEFALVFNSTQSARSIGGETFAAFVVAQLNHTIITKGQQGKFSLMGGSYNTFQAFFALANLTAQSGDFFGLPSYASTMAFELFTKEDMDTFPSDVTQLSVRFLFRNGTDQGPLTAFPLFGGGNLNMTWADFTTEMGKISISTLEDWCTRCQATVGFCQKPTENSPPSASASAAGGKMSNAVAGVIGAMVTLGVVLVLGLVFWFLRRGVAGKKRSGEKGSLSS